MGPAVLSKLPPARPVAVKALSPNHRTAREFPHHVEMSHFWSSAFQAWKLAFMSSLSAYLPHTYQTHKCVNQRGKMPMYSQIYYC